MIVGRGPCEWAQPPSWPCDEKTLRDRASQQASELFFREAEGHQRMRVCSACGEEDNDFVGGVCVTCHNERQMELLRHNAAFDRWESLSDRERGDEIRRAC